MKLSKRWQKCSEQNAAFKKALKAKRRLNRKKDAELRAKNNWKADKEVSK